MGAAVCAASASTKTGLEVEEIEGTRNVAITIMGATGLRANGWAPSPHRPYCICTLSSGETELYCTEAIKDALEPRWQGHATIIRLDMQREVCFTIMDVETASARPAERGSEDVLLSTTLAGDKCECGFTGDLPVKHAGHGPMPLLRVKLRPLDGDFPEPPPMELTIKVAKKPRDRVGLNLHIGDGVTARVAAVQEGPFLPSRLPEGVVLRPGDFIVSVNGLRGNSVDMVSKMKAERRLEIKVRRPVEFGAIMDMQKTGHGLDLSAKLVHNCLLVVEVKKGAFQLWNASNPKQVPVRPRDRLVAIDGVRGTAEDLMAALRGAVRSRGVYLVTFVRPADPESTWWLY